MFERIDRQREGIMRKRGLGHAPDMYLEGPYHAELSCSLALRNGAAAPETPYLGLLSIGPDTDGHGWVELSAPAYRRIPVTLGSRSLERLAVPHPVLFDVEGYEALPTCVGIWSAGDGGDLCWSGCIKAWRWTQAKPSRLEFPAYSLLPRHLPGPAKIFHRNGDARR